MANKIYIFPRYSEKGASSRYRIYNYLEYYRNNGYEVIIHPLFGDWYLENMWQHKGKRKVLHKILYAYLKRLLIILFMPSKSIAYIGAELFPYIPYGFENILILKKIKYIVEFDDAIFHYYDLNSSLIIRELLGNKTKKVISKAACVITGSEYLTKYATQCGQFTVVEIPTSIDEKKYLTCTLIPNKEFIIGWIGSFSQSVQIIDILPALKLLAEKYTFKLHLIGFDKSFEHYLQGFPYEIIKWSDDTEIFEMTKFSVGIMPLDDTLFSKGKCAFKLVQYMAIGIPTISTPLLSNLNINRNSNNLFARTHNEWYSAFVEILENQEKYIKVGIVNKEIAMQNYTIQANFDKHLNVFKNLFMDYNK